MARQLQGSSATLRLGGSARFVTIIGLGKNEAPAKKWGASAFKAAGSAVAAAANSNKCASAAFAVVGDGAIDAQVCAACSRPGTAVWSQAPLVLHAHSQLARQAVSRGTMECRTSRSGSSPHPAPPLASSLRASPRA